MKSNASILSMYAVTPCHAGSGSSTGVVDLPIQRERHTNWPVVASSGVKGAMRAHFDKFKTKIEDKVQTEQFKQITELVFGSDKSEFAGSLSVSDAKILAFPMRSNVAPFVWITCPAILKRLARDLKLAGEEMQNISDLDKLAKENGWSWKGAVSGRTLVEDMEILVSEKPAIDQLLKFFHNAERLIVVHDEVFNYGVSHCTSVTAQIKIDQSTGTTQNGSLRYQEELPADTLMYSVIFWGDSRDSGATQKADAIKGYITKEVMKDFIQIGGDETCGRGIFELNWNEGN